MSLITFGKHDDNTITQANDVRNNAEGDDNLGTEYHILQFLLALPPNLDNSSLGMLD